MSYKPQVDDYVIWNRGDLVHKGWVYFADDLYITIETGIKPKPNCEYTKNENTNTSTHYYSAIRGFGKN